MNYEALKEKVKEKLSSYGSVATITRKGDRVYNKETHTYESTETNIIGCGYLSTIDISKANGTTLLFGDAVLMCSFNETPVIGDVLTFGMKKYNVLSVNPLNPNGEVDIYYNLQLR